MYIESDDLVIRWIRHIVYVHWGTEVREDKSIRDTHLTWLNQRNLLSD